MSTSTLARANDTERWLRFLARWALAMVLVGLGLLIVYFGGIGFSPADNALGEEYSELLQAVRAPAMHRLAMIFDPAGWLMMGGTMLTLAYILKGRMPIRALFIAACGVGMLSGFSAGVMRFVGISDLAVRYAAADPGQQAGLRQSMLALYQIISSLFVVGDVLAGAAYLLIASGLFALGAFPRWLAGWFALAGLLSLLQAATSAVGAFSFVILLLTVVVGIMGAHAGLAAVLWRAPATHARALQGA